MIATRAMIAKIVRAPIMMNYEDIKREQPSFINVHSLNRQRLIVQNNGDLYPVNQFYSNQFIQGYLK